MKQVTYNVPLNLMDAVVVIDCEAGGLDPQRHALLQVSLVASRDRELTLDVYLDGEVTEQALKINGIDLEKHKGLATPLADACAAIQSFLKKAQETAPGGKLIAAGHHTAFDLAFLTRLFANFNLPCPLSTYRSLDTQTLLFQEFACGVLPPEAMSLNPACQHYGVHHDDVHTALGDARATRRLLVRLLNPGCHERNGLFVRDTQLLLDGQWVEVEMEALAPGDVFRQCEGTRGWGAPYVAVEKSFPDGDLGNFGVKAELVPRPLFQKIGIPT